MVKNLQEKQTNTLNQTNEEYKRSKKILESQKYRDGKKKKQNEYFQNLDILNKNISECEKQNYINDAAIKEQIIQFFELRKQISDICYPVNNLDEKIQYTKHKKQDKKSGKYDSYLKQLRAQSAKKSRYNKKRLQFLLKKSLLTGIQIQQQIIQKYPKSRELLTPISLSVMEVQDISAEISSEQSNNYTYMSNLNNTEIEESSTWYPKNTRELNSFPGQTQSMGPNFNQNNNNQNNNSCNNSNTNNTVIFLKEGLPSISESIKEQSSFEMEQGIDGSINMTFNCLELFTDSLIQKNGI